MPVVQKFFKLQKEEVDRIAPIMAGTTWVTKYDEPLWWVERELRNPDLMKVWAASVKFIIWYNSQPK